MKPNHECYRRLVETKRVETPSGVRFLFYCLAGHDHDTRQTAAMCSRDYSVSGRLAEELDKP